MVCNLFGMFWIGESYREAGWAFLDLAPIELRVLLEGRMPYFSKQLIWDIFRVLEPIC